MNMLRFLFTSSIGKKAIMAATGLVLVGFVIGHLVGNLQIFSSPEKINAYAHFLQSLGPALWAIRGFLLLCLILHVWMAVLLTLENKKARPASYSGQKTLRATYASRTMRFSGIIVFAFIIYHLMHFTVKSTHGSDFYPMTVLDGARVYDVHSMMVYGFQNVWVSLFYIVAVALLSWHLNHGLVSMFQSLGLKSRSWSGWLGQLSAIFSILYFVGNAAIVLAVLLGYVTIQNDALPESLCQLVPGASSAQP